MLYLSDIPNLPLLKLVIDSTNASSDGFTQDFKYQTCDSHALSSRELSEHQKTLLQETCPLLDEERDIFQYILQDSSDHICDLKQQIAITKSHLHWLIQACRKEELSCTVSYPADVLATK